MMKSLDEYNPCYILFECKNFVLDSIFWTCNTVSVKVKYNLESIFHSLHSAEISQANQSFNICTRHHAAVQHGPLQLYGCLYQQLQ